MHTFTPTERDLALRQVQRLHQPKRHTPEQMASIAVAHERYEEARRERVREQILQNKIVLAARRQYIQSRWSARQHRRALYFLRARVEAMTAAKFDLLAGLQRASEDNNVSANLAWAVWGPTMPEFNRRRKANFGRGE